MDTDAWIEGVIQRIPKEALIARLQGEREQLDSSIQDHEGDIKYICKRMQVIQSYKKIRHEKFLTARVNPIAANMSFSWHVLIPGTK